jgi:2-C-methyl-D-erythritol 2,4-cyclodiphosphate synthase
MTLRIGQGVDIHAFSTQTSRPLVLGGVVVAPEGGLEGHSDADAPAHALCDALLGAAGLGDLGRHFPDTDPRFKGADSLTLLGEVLRLINEANVYPIHADITVIAERPKLAPHIDGMAQRLGAVIGVPVSVKATRAEGLGALGRVEGIAALAVALCEVRS